MFDPCDSEIAGEGNDQMEVDGSSDMELQVEKWRAQAAAISDSAGILAGGDGPARKKKGVINPINVYGIGETTVEFWANRKAEDVQIMCSGGNVDWAM